MKVLYTVLLLLFVGAVVVFCVQNSGSVAVTYANASAEVPLAALVVAVYVLGMLTGGTALGILRRSYRKATEHSH